MARPLRLQSPGIYHVTCRGNRRQPIFTDDHDRERYLAFLATVSRKLGWRCLVYCLMSNHVHLVLDVPDGTLSRGMQLLSGQYAQAYNRRHGWIGHLFQGRFHSEAVEQEGHGLELTRYVPDNPRRAGMVTHAADWRWSSLRAVLGRTGAPSFLDTAWTLRQFGHNLRGTRVAYEAFVQAGAGLRRPAPADISRGQTPGRVPPGRVPDD